MKVTASCGACGASFGAPASLQGQVVKCPACGGSITVPEAGGKSVAQNAAAAAAASGRSATGEHRAASGQTAMGVSGVSAIAGLAPGNGRGQSGSGLRRGAGVEAAPGHSTGDGLDRVKNNRLYQAYAGIDTARETRRFRFTVGLGVAILVLLVAVSVGGYLVFTSSRKAPPAANPVAVDPPKPVETAGANTASGSTTDSGEAKPTTVAPPQTNRPQAVNASARWVELPPLGRSPVSVKSRVETGWDPATGRQSFNVRVTPVGGGLNMGSRVVLYRAPAEAGPFTQVDAANPTSLDPSGALVYTVFDDEALTAGHNRVHYRLVGEDGDGRRTFDGAPAEFAVIPGVKIDGGKLTWKPASESGDVPPLRIVATAAATGWTDAVLAEVTPKGAVSEPVPGADAALPVKVAVRAAFPTSLDASSSSMGAWRTTPSEYVVSGADAGGAAPKGVLPVWEGEKLAYRLLPDGAAFADVREGGSARTRELTFRVSGASSDGTLTLAEPPAPTHVMVTPFDRSVRVSWVNRDLVDGLGRYADGAAVAIFRQADNGQRQVVAMLDPAQTSYTDRGVAPGMRVRYEVRVTAKHNPDVPAMYRASAYIDGRGELPVLVEVRPGKVAEPVAVEAGLTRAQVALGINELCYAGTDGAALAVRKALFEAMGGRPGAAVLDRATLRLAQNRVQHVGATPRASTAVALEPRLGAPAHMQVRLADARVNGTTMVRLWCTDLVGDQEWMLAEAPAAELINADRAATFVAPLIELVALRAPEAGPADAGTAPSQIVMGPIVPIDEPRRFFGAENIASALIAAGEKAKLPIVSAALVHTLTAADPLAAPGVVVLGGRVWSGSDARPGLLVTAVEGATGRVLGEYRTEDVAPGTADEFAAWCKSLRVAPSTVTDGAQFAQSELIGREVGLSPVNEVFLKGASLPAPSGIASMATPALPGGARSSTFAFGLPLPDVLAAPPGVSRRLPSDPLFEVRPFVAQPEPATFDRWVSTYATYVAADQDAFKLGLEAVASAIRERGPAVPRFVVRGEEKFVGKQPFSGPLPPAVDPNFLVTRGLFPQGGPNAAPAVDYRADLEAFFNERPWAASHAWKTAPPAVADPFLKAVLMGVTNGAFGRLELNTNLPPTFAQYTAAVALEAHKTPQVDGWRRKAVENAQKAVRELTLAQPTAMTAHQQLHVTNAMLILLAEGDAAALAMLRDPAMLDQCVVLTGPAAADALRLLVDRLGPVAWQWAQRKDVDWHAFLWRDAAEMRAVTQAMPGVFPASLITALQEWSASSAFAGSPAVPPTP